MRRAPLALAAVALAAAALPAGAQSWRTITAQREIAHEDALHVTVVYGLGKLTVRAAEPAVLYDLNARFDAEAFRVHRGYDAAARSLFVGADSAAGDQLSVRLFPGGQRHRTSDGYLTLGVARGIPVDLTVKLGIGAANLELGDLWLSRLALSTRFGGAEVDFRTPNPQPMKEVLIDSHFGGVDVKELGNTHAELVRIAVTFGGADVDLRGAWTGEMQVAVNARFAGVSLMVPRDVGVMVDASTKLGGASVKGFVRKGSALYSPNYDSAPRKLHITGSTTFGAMDVEWVEP
ncbi:MAG TPA: LiaF domain-containing protein [Gemmatimonadaceae bacterium]|nr:LiaF domain-containing protein [Gemmatimonadaceae bacterium]